MALAIHAIGSLQTARAVCGEATPEVATLVQGQVTCPACLERMQPAGDSRYPDDRIAEGVLLAQVRELAHGSGFITYHTYRSTRSEPGWFDVALAKPGRPLFLAELKTARGKLTQEQLNWYNAVRQATGVEAHIWRPRDIQTIARLLAGP